MIKKKTENFQNPISENYDPPISHKLFNYFYYLVPIIYLFIIFFFPKVGLIINSISLVYLSYLFYTVSTAGGGVGIFAIFILPPLIIVIILQIMLLFIVVFSGKKAETKDND
jgi:hypothetical protein